MSDPCVICGKRMRFMQKGTCWHENGLQHHLACALTPEMEQQLLTKKLTMLRLT